MDGEVISLQRSITLIQVSRNSITGIVDQHPNGLGAIAQPLGDSCDIPRFMKIGEKHLTLDRELLNDRACERFEAVTVSSNQDKIVARASQSAGIFNPEPATCAGDERPLCCAHKFEVRGQLAQVESAGAPSPPQSTGQRGGTLPELNLRQQAHHPQVREALLHHPAMATMLEENPPSTPS